MADDYQRYVEHLQSEMLSRGWETVFDHPLSKEHYKNNFERLRKTLRNQGFSNEESLVQNFERQAAAFEPATKFDLPFTDQIFGPCLKRIEEAAKANGLNLLRP